MVGAKVVARVRKSLLPNFKWTKRKKITALNPVDGSLVYEEDWIAVDEHGREIPQSEWTTDDDPIPSYGQDGFLLIVSDAGAVENDWNSYEADDGFTFFLRTRRP